MRGGAGRMYVVLSALSACSPFIVLAAVLVFIAVAVGRPLYSILHRDNSGAQSTSLTLLFSAK